MFFFELLQVAIGNKSELSHTPTAEEWREFYALAQKQTMIGIAFRGVEQLPVQQRPPKSLLMPWMMVTERIKAMNADLDRKALAVANKFLEEGFPGVVLKGQGIAKLYEGPHPNPLPRRGELGIAEGLPEEDFKDNLSSYRMPGDIDIWLHGERKDILKYVHRYIPDCKPVYHHVDFPVIEGLDIEVHFTPSWMNSPFTNRRLQQFFRDERNLKFEVRSSTYSEIPSPSIAFNRVYVLVHVFRHLFSEGIGLRQLLDYYFVLHQGFTAAERAETMRTLSSLRMGSFVGAVMWVLQEVYGMEDRYLLTDPNEKEGRFLLSEIMLAGNFGKYDERLQHERGETSIQWALRKIKRNFRFIGSYPSEVLWSPVWKIWHWCWRKKKGYL